MCLPEEARLAYSHSSQVNKSRARGLFITLHGSGVDVLIGLGLTFAALALYLRTLAPGLLPGDAGEFQFTAPTLGLPHPTGYPLYTILGWAWSHLVPYRDYAWRMNAFSALWGAAAVGLLYLVATRFLVAALPCSEGRVAAHLRLAAILTAFAFAASPTFWSQAVWAEVYTLHATFVALILLLTLRCGERKPASLLPLAAAVGLSLAHHRTTILLLPGVVIYLLGTRVAWPASPRGWVTLILALALPLLLYLYVPWSGARAGYLHIPLAPGQTLHVYETSLRGFLTWITGSTFAGELRTPAKAWAQLPAAWLLLRQQFASLGMALAALGLARLALGRRWSLLALTGLTFLMQTAFNLFYGIGDVFVLYIPAYLVVALWLGLGAAALAAMAMQIRFLPMPVRRFVPSFLVMLLLVAFLPSTLQTRKMVDRSRAPDAHIAWRVIFSLGVPDNAILLSNDRDEMTPLIYLQQVEGQRRDVTGLFPLISPGPAWSDIGAVADSALATGRPVYLIKPMPGLEVKFRLEPRGGVVQVLGPAVTKPPPHPTDLSFAGLVRLIGYDVRASPLRPGGALPIDLYWQPMAEISDNYHTFIHLFNEAGEKITQSDHPPGGVFYPTNLWRPGEMLRDRHLLALPSDLQRGRYRLFVGLYHYPSLQRLGEAVFVGEVEH